MTQPCDRPATALLIVDVQTDVVATAHDRDGVIANINTLVDKARRSDAPVIWIQHDDEGLPVGTPGWQIVDELKPRDGEPVVRKNYRDSFEATTLDAELQARDVGRLVVTGSQTDFCVRWTLHGAHTRGYDTVLVADAHTTDAESPPGLPSGAEIIAHTNNIWASQTSPSVTASVLPTRVVEF